MVSYLHVSFVIILIIIIGCKSTHNGISIESEKDLDNYVLGNFIDDYDIEYEISVDKWTMKPNTILHILEWNKNKSYFIARNDANNPYDPGKYTRIDYAALKDMEPYTWAFCIIAFDAETPSEAKNTDVVNLNDLKNGCNGFPFSRMKVKSP